ncbi:hypothetical protein OIU76_004388 [Salix suchowensis]|nr:hypothetical protein OIU76_004388 [Salix suchowensis]
MLVQEPLMTWLPIWILRLMPVATSCPPSRHHPQIAYREFAYPDSGDFGDMNFHMHAMLSTLQSTLNSGN